MVLGLRNILWGDLCHVLDILGINKPKFGFAQKTNKMTFPNKSSLVDMVTTAFEDYTEKQIAANEDFEQINIKKRGLWDSDMILIMIKQPASVLGEA